MRKPDFFVFTSPLNGEEETDPRICIIVLDRQDGIEEFVDHLDKHSVLSVQSFCKRFKFFYTYGTMYNCTLIEVQVKDDAKNMRLNCDQVAIAETYSYFATKEALTA